MSLKDLHWMCPGVSSTKNWWRASLLTTWGLWTLSSISSSSSSMAPVVTLPRTDGEPVYWLHEDWTLSSISSSSSSMAPVVTLPRTDGEPVYWLHEDCGRCPPSLHPALPWLQWWLYQELMESQFTDYMRTVDAVLHLFIQLFHGSNGDSTKNWWRVSLLTTWGLWTLSSISSSSSSMAPVVTLPRTDGELVYWLHEVCGHCPPSLHPALPWLQWWLYQELMESQFTDYMRTVDTVLHLFIQLFHGSSGDSTKNWWRVSLLTTWGLWTLSSISSSSSSMAPVVTLPRTDGELVYWLHEVCGHCPPSLHPALPWLQWWLYQELMESQFTDYMRTVDTVPHLFIQLFHGSSGDSTKNWWRVSLLTTWGLWTLSSISSSSSSMAPVVTLPRTDGEPVYWLHEVCGCCPPSLHPALPWLQWRLQQRLQKWLQWQFQNQPP